MVATAVLMVAVAVWATVGQRDSRGGKMPFKSRKQMRFMFAKKPKLAKKWANKYGTKDVPETAKGILAKRAKKG